VFAHNTALPDCKFRYLKKGEEVVFRVEQQEKGLAARGVRAASGQLICEGGEGGAGRRLRLRKNKN